MDLVAAGEVQVDEMGADETGPSGNQDMHDASPEGSKNVTVVAINDAGDVPEPANAATDGCGRGPSGIVVPIVPSPTAVAPAGEISLGQALGALAPKLAFPASRWHVGALGRQSGPEFVGSVR